MRKIAHIFVTFSEKLNFNMEPLKTLHDTKSILNYQGGVTQTQSGPISCDRKKE